MAVSTPAHRRAQALLLRAKKLARQRLNDTTDLIDRLIDIREMLHWQLDADVMRDAVAELKRDIWANRSRWRR